MSKAKRKRVKRKQGKRKGNRKEASNVNKGQLRVSILVLLFLLSIIGYVVYTAILITGIEKNDPLEENGSSAYLLSSTSSDDLDKTLWIFEEGEGDDKKITEAFLVASNREKNFLLNIYIPGWIRFSLAEEEFGNALTVSNFRYAGEFLNEGRGIEYAIWQFEQMLGTKIDSYIWIGKREQSLYSEVFGYYKDPKGTYGYDFSKEDFAQNTLLLDNFVSEYSFLGIILHPQKVSGIGDGIISNRSFADILGKIISTRKELRRSEKYIIDLGNTKYIDEELSNAGGLSYYLNSSKYDGVLREYSLIFWIEN